MEYMEKIVSNERTGANISGIHVDTAPSKLLHKPDLDGLAILEKIAKETEALALKNKKSQFMLEIEQMDLDFKEKWNDPNVYEDDEQFNSMQAESKELEKQKFELLQKNKFFNLEEKNTLKKKMDLTYQERTIQRVGERNKVYIRREAERTQAIAQQWEAIGAKESIYNESRTKEIQENIIEQYQSLGKLLHDTPEEIQNKTANALARMYNAQVQNELNSLLSNPNMPLTTKENKLKQIENIINNDKYSDKVIDDFMKRLGTTDERTKEFLEVATKQESRKVLNTFKTELNRVKAEENRIARAEARARKEAEKQRKHEEKMYALMQNDPKAYYKAVTGKKLTTQELVSNPLALGYVSDGTWEEYGDINNGKAFAILSSSEISEINRSVNYRKNEGMYTDKEIFEPVFDMARTLSNGDILKETAILKDYAMRNGMNPKVFLQGRNNPEYFRVNDVMRKGNAVVNETGFSINENKDNLSRKAKKNYETIAARFSDDEELGALMADQYIVGVIAKSGRLNEFKAKPERFLNKALTEEKKGYSQIKKDIEIATSISSKRVDYKYDYIKTEKTKQKKETKKEQPKKSKYI